MKKSFLLLLLLFTSSAFAAGPFGGRDWNDRYNHPDHHRAGTGSIFPNGRTSTTASSTSTGTSITTKGTERVAGTDIPITVKSDYTRAAITAAAVAAAALCGSNPLTAIICGAAIQYGLEKGIKQCEASGWCQDSPSTEVYYTGQFTETPTIKASTSDSYCQQKFAGGGRTAIISTSNSDGSQGACQFKLNGSTYNGGQWVKKTGSITNPPPPTPSQPPWADPGFPPYLDGRQGNEPNFGPDLLGDAARGGFSAESSPSGGPTVSAPPVSSAPRTSSSSSTRSDGSIDTTTRTDTTTVTPTVNNNNSTNPKIEYNVTNNSSSTVTNNVTNETNITNSTTNTPGAPELQLPTDYNREATQKQIADELAGTNAPAVPADQAARTKTEIAKTDASLKDLFDGLPGKFTADKENWFSWVWTPPVGVCKSSDYSGTVHGYSVTWDICPTVSKIREVLGFLFALFGAYIVYGQIFRGSKS